MSTSEDRHDSIQQVFAKNKPKFITVAVLVGFLCATFLIPPTEEKFVAKVKFKRCLIMSAFTYQAENFRGGDYITGVRCESLLNDSKELERFVKPEVEKYSIDVTDRSREWFARIAIFLFSGALSAALLLLYMTQKKISTSIKVSEKMLTDTDESEDYAQSADDESLTRGLMHSQVMPEEQDRKYEVFDLDSQQSKKLDDEKANAGLLNLTSRNEGLMEAMGANGKITVDEVFITISREGSTGLNKLQNRFSQGYQGEKRIAIAQISAVQFKSVGEYGKGVKSLIEKIPGGEMYDKAFGNVAGATGFIEFVVIGSAEKKGRMLLGGLREMSKNENAIMFGPEQEQAFAKIRDLVEGKIRDRYTSKPAEPVQAAQLDVASQISSLKGLFDSGAISEDEFKQAKAKILGI